MGVGGEHNNAENSRLVQDVSLVLLTNIILDSRAGKGMVSQCQPEQMDNRQDKLVVLV